MKVTALVCRAGLRPLNKSMAGYGDWTTVVTDIGNGPVRITSMVNLDRDRWLLPGSHVTIDLAPERVGEARSYTLEWDSVPPIQDRVAANDPVVTEPRAAIAAAEAAMASAGRIRPMPPGKTYVPRSYPVHNLSAWTAACDEAIAATATQPAPPGRARVVAIVVGLRLLMRHENRDIFGNRLTGGGEQNLRQGTQYRRPLGGTEAVFALTAPGRAPRAVFVPKFAAPSAKDVSVQPTIYPFLPATVAADGSGPVEIRWDEVLDLRAQTGQYTGRAHQQAAAVFQAEAESHAPALPPGVTLPAQAFTDASILGKLWPTYPPQHQQATLARMHASLSTMPPELQQAYVTLWRSYGLPI
ncbi:MAG TPA: hypothetical protein VGF84_04095 [Micromonosporaceae bacterium]